MKILLLNHDWLAQELRDLGHEVVTAGFNTPHLNVKVPAPELAFDEILKMLPFRPDRIVCWDDSALQWFVGIEHVQIPTAFYSVDVHHHHQWHPQFGAMFDVVLVAQKDFVPIFAPLQVEAKWFSLWAMRTPEASPTAVRPLGATFVGTLDPRIHPKRNEFFTALQQKVPVDVRSGDYTKIYTQAKIVINETVSGDLNFRVFEALNCGALLITPEITNGLPELFTNGKEIVTYVRDDVENAAEKIAYYLAHENERLEIAQRGFDQVRARHTSVARAKDLVELLQNLRCTPRARKHFGAASSSITSFLVCRHEKLTWGDGMLKAGARSFLESAKNGEIRDGDFVGLGVLFRHFLDEAGYPDEAMQFITDLSALIPQSDSFRFARLQQMLALGRVHEAEKQCLNWNLQPQWTFENVQELLKDALQRESAGGL